VNNILLTVITISYNSEAEIGQTIESVINLNYNNVEYVFIDGGSADATVEVINSYDEQLNKRGIKKILLSEKDKGIYDAMNKGIGLARGKWIYFLGSDDVLYDNKVLGSVFTFPGLDELDFIYGDIVSPRYKDPYDGPFDFAKLLIFNISHQAIFYRKALFEHFPTFNLRYKGHADWDLNIRLFSDGSVRIRYIGGIIARFGPGGLSSLHDVAFLQEVLFPQRLRLLQQTGLRALSSIRVYDEWWRLLRNAAFPDVAVLQTYAGSATIPAPVHGMMTWQEKIPRRILKMGFCSKIIMSASYLRHFLTGSLQ